ncbi:hypothetical protein C1646_758113 [Rhizophagus diaphanus]|nr:hypothetical protein C1646_758113 [Rhizophagus diaphanus] [Rhizophagus sp. MUCL 43196]
MHERNLVHRDFHDGNILNNKNNRETNKVDCVYISDLGLCKPYTPDIDIYSFSMIIWSLHLEAENLKDWEGLLVEKGAKMKDFCGDTSILHLSSDWWEADFKVKSRPSKTLVGGKVPQCIT